MTLAEVRGCAPFAPRGHLLQSEVADIVDQPNRKVELSEGVGQIVYEALAPAWGSNQGAEQNADAEVGLATHGGSPQGPLLNHNRARRHRRVDAKLHKAKSMPAFARLTPLLASGTT